MGQRAGDLSQHLALPTTGPGHMTWCRGRVVHDAARLDAGAIAAASVAGMRARHHPRRDPSFRAGARRASATVMRSMAVRSEVSVRLPNNPGALGAAFDVLADARVAVEAWCLGGDATLRVVCDNPLLAAELLGAAHPSTARDVMTATVATRDLGRLLRRVAALGVNLDYAYSGAAETADRILLVLGAPDAARTSIQLGL